MTLATVVANVAVVTSVSAVASLGVVAVVCFPAAKKKEEKTFIASTEKAFQFFFLREVTATAAKETKRAFQDEPHPIERFMLM